MKYRLWVKGTVVQAMAAAQERHLVGYVEKEEDGGDQILVVNDQLDKLVSWFCEPPDAAPYPVGTLLFYQEVNEKN